MIEFNTLASITGRPGLFVILKPTRTGVILESLDEFKTRFIIESNSKVSILKDISIYTVDSDRNLGLEKVMTLVFNTFSTDLPVTSKSTDAELKSFFKKAMPQYDSERVYVSDIKKLISWYAIIVKNEPTIFKLKPEVESVSNENSEIIAPKEVLEVKTDKKEVAEDKKVTKSKKSKV